MLLSARSVLWLESTPSATSCSLAMFVRFISAGTVLLLLLLLLPTSFYQTPLVPLSSLFIVLLFLCFVSLNRERRMVIVQTIVIFAHVNGFNALLGELP